MARHDDGKIGIFSETELGAEIAEIKKSIRNYIPFDLMEDLFLDGKKIEQGEMVSFVDQIVSSKGRSRLTYKNGRSFRPASTDHYTFNSALRLFDPSEK